ncbi:MAG: hypothetical protein IE922_14435 [Sphingomonadales bacterium]|nr:hypothetical protein [Sphingomonadales bacterium]
MRITPTRIARAGLAALIATWAVAATLWGHLLLGFGGPLLGQPQALAPALQNSPGSYALACALAAAPLAPVLWGAAVLSGPWPIRVLNLGLLAGGWYWAADRVAMEFAADFGATWLPGEPFAELFFDPLLTPALAGAALLAQGLMLRWLNRPPRPRAPAPQPK